MRIGIVCYPTFGGSGVVATELGKELALKGHEIHFITYKPPARLNAFTANIFYHEVGNFEYPLFEHSTYDTALTSKLVDVVRFEKLDLLHVHYAVPHAAVAFMAKSILAEHNIFIPVITTLHGTDITLVGRDKSFEPVVTFSINKSDGVTAVSKFLKDQTYEEFDITNDIEVIPNFIDLERFSRREHTDFKNSIAPNGEKILVHVSNFRAVKRVEDVIAVFKNVQEVMPSKLLLVGDGPERPRMEQLCRDLNVCNDIRFLGKQEAVEDILAVGDLFLLPSDHESFGLAALEAMSCGVPVVSSNTGGLSEVNIHGLSGYLAPVHDVANMSRYAIEILSSEETLATFRKGALEVARRFEKSRVVALYESYYNGVIKRHKQKVLSYN